MTAKYSTGDENDFGETWDSDERRILAAWNSKPFVGHRHRHVTVEHRIVVEYNHGVGLDVHHEVRSKDTNKFSDDWTVIETIEGRESLARREKAPERRYL